MILESKRNILEDKNKNNSKKDLKSLTAEKMIKAKRAANNNNYSKKSKLYKKANKKSKSKKIFK